MKQSKKLILIALFTTLLLGVCGFLFAWSGLYNVAASKGHWGITRWFLGFGMRNSVETHAIKIEVPKLDDPIMIVQGAGHYQGSCALCHGAPGLPRNPIVLEMLPAPPELGASIKDWSDAELFWIVKHGLKYTGMPGWVAKERNDEVWTVVAFLRQLPALNANEYQRLANGDIGKLWKNDPKFLALAGPVQHDVAACARCHGADGTGRGIGAFPRLSILGEAYLYEALKNYQIGARPSGVMQPVASELTDDEMRKLAAYYANVAETTILTPLSINPQLKMQGEELAKRGAPQQGVPACITCHGPTAAIRSPLYPSLSGQYEPYLAEQLRLWRRGVRGGTPYAEIMEEAVKKVTDEQIVAVAHYYASLPPDGSAKKTGPAMDGSR